MRRRSAVVPLTFVALTAFGAFAGPRRSAGAHQGWTFTWQTVYTMDAAGSHMTDSQSMHAAVAGSRARIALPNVPMDLTGAMAGSFILLDGDSGAMTWVVPTMRMSASFDPMRIGDVAQTMNKRMWDVSSVTQDLGPGEPILGFGTRHIRLVRAYRLGPSDARDPSTIRVELESEEWRAPDLAIANVLDAWSSNLLLSAASAAGASMRHERAPWPEPDSIAKGFTLRSITSQTIRTGRDHTSKLTAQMEVRDLERAMLDDSLLQVPPGYRTMEAPSQRSLTKADRDRLLDLCRRTGAGKSECARRLEPFDFDSTSDSVRKSP